MSTNSIGLDTVPAVRQTSFIAARTSLDAVAAIRLSSWVLLLLFGAAQAYGARHQLNVDGVAYLDVADAYLRGDWLHAVNGHWSPLYSWLLAAVSLLHPSVYWEFAAAHLLNLGIFAATLAAFELMLGELVRRTDAIRGSLVTLPAWAWYALGYCLFAWISLRAVTLILVTPDLLTSAFLYLAVAFLLRISRGARAADFALLGGALGLGYLAKAPMLPIGAGMMALAVLAADGRRVHRALLTAVVFGAIAGPFIGALSLQKGRLTFGESRIISYAWLVQDLPLRHWQGDARSRLAHPTRLISTGPAVYEFATPLPGTYPVWYDPSFWYEGLQAHFDGSAQGRAVLKNMHEYYSLLFVGPLAILVFAIALLSVQTPLPREWLRTFCAQWPVLLPAMAGLLMFALVSAFPRYVGPFLGLLLLAALAAIRLPDTEPSRRLTTSACVLAAGLFAAALLPGLAAQLGRSVVDAANGEHPREHPYFQVAQAVQAQGIHEGDAVAVLHSADTSSWSAMTAWARAARVRVVAEILPEDAPAFLGASEAARQAIEERLAAAGAVALITPSSVPGWTELGSTGYSVRRLSPPPHP